MHSKTPSESTPDTIQFFHGSEVAWWENADEHMTGALQAVPDAPDTEIVLESTANGIGGLFYSMCKEAEHGDSDYQLVFIPWHWHGEYRHTAPKGWKAPPAFADYGEVYHLDPNQVYWAWLKNRELAQSTGGEAEALC